MTTWLYIGGYGSGIYRARFDSASGAISDAEQVVETPNPSFLLVHPEYRVLYAVNEVADLDGSAQGGVAAYTIQRAGGALTFRSQQLSGGQGPCQLALDRTGRWLIVSNYGSGSAAVLQVGANGGLGPAVAVSQHTLASGADPGRQEGPHAHSAAVTPDNRYALVADLGGDRLYAYELNTQTGAIHEDEGRTVLVGGGAGPRYVVVHPQGRFVYLLTELSNDLIVYKLSENILTEQQRLPVLPGDFSGESYAAHLAVSPAGDYVYASNRGYDSIAVFVVDAASGTLTPAGWIETGGRMPRHFCLDREGRWLIVANQESNTLISYPLTDGHAGPAAATISVPRPTCVIPVELA